VNVSSFPGVVYVEPLSFNSVDAVILEQVPHHVFVFRYMSIQSLARAGVWLDSVADLHPYEYNQLFSSHLCSRLNFPVPTDSPVYVRVVTVLVVHAIPPTNCSSAFLCQASRRLQRYSVL